MEDEIKSLKRLNYILGTYDITFLCPQNFDASYYLSIIPNAKIDYFELKFFKDIAGYSSLMLSPRYYKKYLNYDFILVYQPDAYVFSDELMYWANKNYDYIGAPWQIPPPNVKNEFIQWLFTNNVGNGGFSLRKTRSFYINSIVFMPIISFFSKNEDMFWGIIINYINPFFKKPKATEALHFAFELAPKQAFEEVGKLPFGVHAWQKYEPKFWKKYID